MEQDSPKVVSSKFNTIVNELISMLERRTRSELEMSNLDRLRKRIRLLKSTLGDEALIQASASFFVKYSEMILEPDVSKREEYFMNTDVRAEYLKHCPVISKQDEFVFSMCDSIRSHYKRAEAAERDTVHSKVVTLLRHSVEYKMLTGT